MRYYLIAGEASGDLHGSNLMKNIKLLDNEAEFRFCGGDLMLQENTNCCIHIKEMAFMGFVEVLQNLGTIRKNMKKVKQDIAAYRPNIVVLIDYPGFNLRMAEFAHGLGIKTHYYISPKVWAWKASRIKKIKAFVDKMLVILPFEKEFFKQHQYAVEYVGNPLLDSVAQYQLQEKKPLNFSKPILAILPGSRKMEIKNMLPIMLETAAHYKDYQPVIAAVNQLQLELYQQINTYQFPMVFNQTYDLLAQAHVAMVTSGTATLETALFSVPQVVCYKGNGLSVWIAKRLVKIKYISLVNLILDRLVVKELIQNDLNLSRLKTEINLLTEGAGREKMLKDYQDLIQVMGAPGASERAAKSIVEHVKI